MEQKLLEYQNEGFLDATTIDGNELLYLTTPCRFCVDEKIVSNLKENYKEDEEVGGILWSKPTNKNGEIVHIINHISYIKNAIEDNARADNRNKSNAYLPDFKQKEQILNTLFSKGFLPILFHTHPVNGINFLHSVSNFNTITETSEQDKRESLLPFIIGNKKIILPRALIVSNQDLSSNLFLGLYNGFIAPVEFENSKRNIQQENLKKAANLVSSMEFSKDQKTGLAIGAALLLFLILKYSKYSWPVIICLCKELALLVKDTKYIKEPNYFNILSIGSANIYIP